MPVRILSEVSAAALGEFRFGHSAPNLLLYALGTGIGGGVVVDLGHQMLKPDGELCRCGTRGCRETLVSGPARAGCALLGRPDTVAELVALPESRPWFARAGE
jgi:predicted NBD/HSP70 family sugar kinase